MSASPVKTVSSEESPAELSADDGWLSQQTGWLRQLIDRRVRHFDCSDEVLQEVMVAAIRSPRVPENPNERLPWLASVAIRQCALAMRTWARRRKRESEYGAIKQIENCPTGGDPIFMLLASEQATIVREQFDRLDPLQKQLLAQKYVQGMTYKQIAASMNMEVSAVEYRLTLARKALRIRVVAAGIGEVESNE